ncbi:MAG: metallophosphoesterase family protein [Sarcina sp.]
MRNIKIVQCGDIHFDTPFRGLPKDISMLKRAELKECFSRIIDKALKENIDLFLLTGDMFDNDTVEKDTLNFIKSQIERLGKIQVLIVAGNHDPYNSKSFYTMINWGKNVHIFHDEFSYIEFKNINTVVYGSSFANKYCKESKLLNFKLEEKHKNMIKLMVIHGEVTNSNLGEYNPISLDNICNSKMDYIALGHIHKFIGVNRVGNTYYAYSGCPEGRGFDECGDKGIIIGEINKNFCDLKFYNMSKRKYINLDVNINHCTTIEDIQQTIIKSISNYNKEINLFSITLIGDVSEELNINIKTLEAILKENVFYIKIKDKTNIKLNLETISNETSLRGVFCTKILNEIYKCDDKEELELLELALRIGMKSIREQEVNVNDN